MKIVKSSDVPWTDALKQGKYVQRRKPLTSDSPRLSASLFELAPGKKSFPLHAHHVTEEALYVISGTAKVRTPEGLTAIGPGDFVSFPAGGVAHQLVNDGSVPLVYLAMSSNAAGADVVDYPDTGKVAMSLGSFPKGRRMIFDGNHQSDYFAGDPDAQA